LLYTDKLYNCDGIASLVAVASSTARAVVRSLWPASCLGVSRANVGVVPVLCAAFGGPVTKGDVLIQQFEGELVSVAPPSVLPPATCKQENDLLASVIMNRKHANTTAKISPFHHPWIHGRASAQCHTTANPSYGCGEQGHTLIRRLFFPGAHTCEQTDNVGGVATTMGYMQRLACANERNDLMVSICHYT
jgi:hypothetical protein